MAICGESSSSFSNVQTPSGWDPSVQEFSGVSAIRNTVGHLRHMLRRTACKALGSQCESAGGDDLAVIVGKARGNFWLPWEKVMEGEFAF